MKTLVQKLLLFTFLIASIAHVSSAETAPKLIYQGVDITPMVAKFSEFVRPLKRPITVYHWAPKGYYPPFLTDVTSNGPFLKKFARFSSDRFWRNYGEKTELMRGRGLYAAIDPFISSAYGGAKWGYEGAWLLLEIELPVGLKVFDTRLDIELNDFGPAYQAIKDETILRVAKQFDCSLPIGVVSAVSPDIFSRSQKCQDLFKHILRDILKIDLIAYSYGGSLEKVCAERSDDPAFVIVSDRWLKTGSVKAFTKRTRILRDDRLRILSILANEKDEKTIGKAQTFSTEKKETLWSDLIGEQAINTQDWLQKNRFGCDGSSPF